MTGERTRNNRGWRERRPILRRSRGTAHKSYQLELPGLQGDEPRWEENDSLSLSAPHCGWVTDTKIPSHHLKFSVFTDTPSSPSLVFLPPLPHPPPQEKQESDAFHLEGITIISLRRHIRGEKHYIPKVTKLTKWKYTFV